MKRLSTICFLVTVFCLTTISTYAQSITYVDADYKPATAANYTYKRVIKYVKPIINPNIGTGYYGGITSNPQPSGLHVCSLIDYYTTGEPALVVNVLTLDLKCSEWAFDGTATYYFKSGNIKRKEPYKTGKLHGTAINYDEDGREIMRIEYENGKLIDPNKFTASADSPLVGTWKYEERTAPFVVPDLKINRPGSLTKLITVVFSSNGIFEITIQAGFVGDKSYFNGTERRNWKYISKSSSSGVIEQYLGDDLFERVNVKWLGTNQFEWTTTFHQDASNVGNQFTFTRQ